MSGSGQGLFKRERRWAGSPYINSGHVHLLLHLGALTPAAIEDQLPVVVVTASARLVVVDLRLLLIAPVGTTRLTKMTVVIATMIVATGTGTGTAIDLEAQMIETAK